jgi:L-gulono-1,4-lactone dehydrogenase
MDSLTVLTNFGGNVRIQPQQVFTPENEEEVLGILAAVRGRRIRVIGRLHSWSEAPVGDDVVLDLRRLDSVRVDEGPDGTWATIGAGCQIKRLLFELERLGNWTTPSLGLITEQAIAGAISTGTHGSGKHSLSHYIDEVRVATYDPQTGKPVIVTFNEGPELRAARCSLGCLGAIVSVKFRCRPQYRVEECVRAIASVDEALAAEETFPLQQFFLIPWCWNVLAQHRRETEAPRSWTATLYRIYWFVSIDLGLHLLILTLVQLLKWNRAVRFFFRLAFSRVVVRGWRVVDKSSDMLIMEHELFRHIEIELFVKRSRLPAALAFVRDIIEVFGRRGHELSSEHREALAHAGLLERVIAGAGTYTHHYPICIRRILPDDTLMSMASSDVEAYYSISLISYAKPHARTGYFEFADLLARSMAALFEARPHWGKVCPVDAQTVAKLYPHLSEFQRVCQQWDAAGMFRNHWIDEILFGSSAVER